jgi:carbonic anhydrase/acetyltransferase-like protein (isoleucine patch superfamily)
VIGDVTVGAGSSVWPFAVLRGDQDNYVTLGRNSNVQDNSVLHVTPEFPFIVGDFVTIGHRAVVHACRVMGVPAKPIRKMDRAELDDILKNAPDYIELWHRDYR